MFFDSLSDLLRVVVVGALGYASLVLFLRVSGKRTLSKMNAFDLVVTVALGSTLATMLLSSEVSLFEGLVALVLLIGLQYSIAWLSTRSSAFAGLIRAEPSMVVYRGELQSDVMNRERVTEADVDAALRSAGVLSIDEVFCVVLETDGSFSVIRRQQSLHTELLLDGFERPQVGEIREDRNVA